MDTSAVQLREINENALNKFRQDEDFQYNRYLEPPKSLLEKFWLWFWSRVTEMMRTKQGRITTWTLLILLSLAIIIFFVIKVMGMNKGGLFARSSESDLPYTISADDIHTISFNDAVNEAIQKGNFRLALRLLYLQSLKTLSDKGYIDWQINKTNSDYLSEVNNRPWHALFKTLTLRFEYTWYGERNIGKDDFKSLQLQFQQFNNQLQ
ncbi:MAG TPA: DUF4129 domain-containing protein [Segetibacter sp.]|jgi:hypothetical protein